MRERSTCSTRPQGEQIRRILAPDGGAGDEFGVAVAMAPGVLAIGAPNHDAGAVYLFDPDTGDLTGKIEAPTHFTGNSDFGVSLAIDDGRLLVGARSENQEKARAGAAYLFELSTENLLHRLAADEPREGRTVGQSVALDGPFAVAGTHPDFASVLAFNSVTGNHLDLLTPPEPGSQLFGIAVAADEGRFATGSLHGVDDYAGAGVVWVYQGLPEPATLPLVSLLLAASLSCKRPKR